MSSSVKPLSPADRALLRRAAKAAGIVVEDGETMAGIPCLMELDDGSSLTRRYDPLEQPGRVTDLIAILGLAVAVDLDKCIAYAGTLGLPDLDNPVQVPFEDAAGARAALARAVVTAAAARCE